MKQRITVNRKRIALVWHHVAYACIGDYVDRDYTCRRVLPLPTTVDVRSGIWSASTATGMSVSEDGSEIRYPDPRLTHRVSFVIDEAAHSSSRCRVCAYV